MGLMGFSPRGNRSGGTLRSENRTFWVEKVGGPARKVCRSPVKPSSSEEVSRGCLKNPWHLPDLLDLNAAGGQVKSNSPPFGSPDILGDHGDAQLLESSDGFLDIGFPDLQRSACGKHASPAGQLCLQFVWRDSEGLAKCLHKVKDSGVDELSRGPGCLPIGLRQDRMSQTTGSAFWMIKADTQTGTEDSRQFCRRLADTDLTHADIDNFLNGCEDGHAKVALFRMQMTCSLPNLAPPVPGRVKSLPRSSSPRATGSPMPQVVTGKPDLSLLAKTTHFLDTKISRPGTRLP